LPCSSTARLVFRILDGDVNRERGETANGVAAEAVRNLETALAEMREARDSSALLPAIGYALLATLLAAIALWLIWRGQRWVIARLRSFALRKRESLLPGWAASSWAPVRSSDCWSCRLGCSRGCSRFS
jgi:hypothetical protein